MAQIKREVDVDSPQFGQCRCCLSQGYGSDVMSEFFRNGQPESYYNIFVQCFNLYLKTNEGLPTLICVKCVTMLQEAYVFRQMVQQSELELLSSLTQDDGNNTLLVPAQCQPAPEMTLEAEEATNIEVKLELEPMSDEEEMDTEDFILPDFATAPVLFESPENLVPGEAALLCRFPEGSLRPLPAHRKHFKALSDWTYLRNLDKLRDKEVPAASLEKLLKPPQELSEIQKEKQAHIENITALLNNSNAISFNTVSAGGFKYTCFYCRLFYKEFEDLKNHQTTQHTNQDVRKLVMRESLAKLVIYAEITDLKCKICDENVLNFDFLKQHLIEKHQKTFYEGYQLRLIACRIVKDKFICQECNETFANFTTLERHLTEEHYKYFECDLCNTGFITSRRLSVHMRNRHKNSFQCGCKKIFNSVRNLRMHKCDLKPECKLRADKK